MTLTVQNVSQLLNEVDPLNTQCSGVPGMEDEYLLTAEAVMYHLEHRYGDSFPSDDINKNLDALLTSVDFALQEADSSFYLFDMPNKNEVAEKFKNFLIQNT